VSAASYNRKQYESGALTDEMIARLVEAWQRGQLGLAVDGYAGPNTIASLNARTELEKFYPLPKLADGREPVITSTFYTENPSRPKHNGVDFFYRWLDSDPDVPVGDGGAIRKNGKRRWWYPPGAKAIAAASGVVQEAGPSPTGFRVWLDHGNGERTGYFHGTEVLVRKGDVVAAGTPLISVGDNPLDNDAKHLHFELSPVDRYAPKNPRKWLDGAKLK